MKALDYLYRIKKANEEMGIEPINLYEAIEELEELQNRTCKNCKYVFSDTLELIYCSSPKSPLSSCVFPIHPNFSCNKWESK